MVCTIAKTAVSPILLNALRVGASVLVCARPHQVSLQQNAQSSQGAAQLSSLVLPGTVVAKEFMGQQTRYFVLSDSQQVMIDQTHQLGETPYAVNAHVMISLPISNIKILDI